MLNNLVEKVSQFRSGINKYNITNHFKSLIDSCNTKFAVLRPDLAQIDQDLNLETIVKQPRYDFDWYRRKYSPQELNQTNVSSLDLAKSISETQYKNLHGKFEFQHKPEELIQVMEERLINELIQDRKILICQREVQASNANQEKKKFNEEIYGLARCSAREKINNNSYNLHNFKYRNRLKNSQQLSKNTTPTQLNNIKNNLSESQPTDNTNFRITNPLFRTSRRSKTQNQHPNSTVNSNLFKTNFQDSKQLQLTYTNTVEQMFSKTQTKIISPGVKNK